MSFETASSLSPDVCVRASNERSVVVEEKSPLEYGGRPTLHLWNESRAALDQTDMRTSREGWRVAQRDSNQHTIPDHRSFYQLPSDQV